MVKRFRILSVLFAAMAVAAHPAAAHGAASAPTVSSLLHLLPDCGRCPTPNPRPPGPGFLKLVLQRPDNYTPWETYPMSLEVVSFRGMETRFILFTASGGFTSGDPGVVANNSANGSFVTYRRPFTGPSNSPVLWRFNWTAPANMSGPASLTVLVMNGPGESAPGGNDWLEGQATIWEGSNPRPLPTVPPSAPPSPSSPGFGAAAALGALGVALVPFLRGRR